jgi:hypothetical protein
MSRHAAATTAGRRTIPRSPAPPVPRRVSGPAAPNRRDAGGDGRAPRARIDSSALAFADTALDFPLPRRHATPRPQRSFRHAVPRPQRGFPAAAARPQRLAYGGVAIAQRMAGVAVDVSASRAMDRLVRSRVWIGLIAFGLIGLVTMQVSLLKLNSGIGRAVQTSSTLERSNAALRAEISRKSAGDLIQAEAGAEGLIMPAPSDITYLRAGGVQGDAVRAVQHMRAPDPAATAALAAATTQSAAPDTTTPPAATALTTAATDTSASGTGTPGTSTPGTSTSGTSTPGTSTPATSAPAAPAAIQAAAPPAGAGTAAATPAPTGTTSGGAAPTTTP